MSTESVDFIRGYTQHTEDKKEHDFSLCYAYPIIQNEPENILTRSNKNPRESSIDNTLGEDGLYCPENPFTSNVFKPYHLNDIKMLEYASKRKFCGKLIEIAVREVNIHTTADRSEPVIDVTAVSILFKKKVVCKANSPFNRKLHKLLIKNSECNNISIQLHTQGRHSTILPLPLPKRTIKNNRIDIDFAISDDSGRIYGGTITCTVSISNHGSNQQDEHTPYLYKLTNDPNDPQNTLSLLRPRKTTHKSQVKYFVLEEPALTFDVDSDVTVLNRDQGEERKLPDIVVTEQPAFSLLDISFKNLFQAKRPLKPSSGTRRHHTIGRTVLMVTILRGAEVPVREESALVQPFVEVEWGNTVHTTHVADGPAPIWQQTMHFELSRQNGECCVKLRLYDQHPVWGQQWLGEARIPLEYHRNYQELERWIVLSTLFSPVLLFGYVEASPGQSCTRIYVLMKMEQPGNANSIESSTINVLLKGIQRCLAVPYKINGIEDSDAAAKLTMLLPSLPTHYGPVTPRQALNIRKVDHYGRAALLATLLQGFDSQAYVLLGSSQISRWTAFVLTIGENQTSVLWDPEGGNYYSLGDSHCSLMKVFRLINHFGIWENLQKSILPHNLKYDVKSGKDWRPLDPITSSTSNRVVQTLELSCTDEENMQIKEKSSEMEQYLKDKLSEWRSAAGLPTIFNRHAMTVLRNFISKTEPAIKQSLDKKDLKLLYRAYHIHGFVLNTRQCSPDELTEQLNATKIHNITGPIEFALTCHIQPYIGKISSIWLAVITLRSRY